MALERYHFTTADGIELDLPFYLDAVKRKDVRKMSKAAKEVGGFENLDPDVLLEAANLDKKTTDIIDEMTLRDFTKFIEGWMENDLVGES